MKRLLSLVAVVAMLASLPVMAETPTSKMLSDAVAKAPMLAFLTYTLNNEPPQQGGGQAVCIDAADGIFFTYAVEGWMKPANIKEASLTLSDGKKVNAKLLWVDPETGWGLFQATEKPATPFTAAKFVSDPKFPTGTQVSSVGLLDDASHTAYATSAYVSAVISGPDKVVYVTNGQLAVEGSPVFNEAGEVVGIVTPQPYKRYSTPTQQGQQDMLLKSRQETTFFAPSSAFATLVDYVAKSPNTPRVMPWIGAILDAAPSDLEQPALLVRKVIPSRTAKPRA